MRTSMDRNRAKKLMVIDTHKCSFEVIIVVNCKKDQSQKSCVVCLNLNHNCNNYTTKNNIYKAHILLWFKALSSTKSIN